MRARVVALGVISDLPWLEEGMIGLKRLRLDSCLEQGLSIHHGTSQKYFRKWKLAI